MPEAAWSDPGFMGLLLDNGIPYARLSLLKKAGTPNETPADFQQNELAHVEIVLYLLDTL